MYNQKKSNRLVIILSILVVILSLIILYTFVAKPVMTGYVSKAQNQGWEYAFFVIMNEAATCKPVPLTFENYTIEVIAIDCLQFPSENEIESEMPLQEE